MSTGLSDDDLETSISKDNEIEELHSKIEQLCNQVEKLQVENEKLHNRLQSQPTPNSQLPIPNSQLPDLEVLRTKTLNKMKVGRQSTAGKTLDFFIKELKRQGSPNF